MLSRHKATNNRVAPAASFTRVLGSPLSSPCATSSQRAGRVLSRRCVALVKISFYSRYGLPPLPRQPTCSDICNLLAREISVIVPVDNQTAFPRLGQGETATPKTPFLRAGSHSHTLIATTRHHPQGHVTIARGPSAPAPSGHPPPSLQPRSLRLTRAGLSCICPGFAVTQQILVCPHQKISFTVIAYP